MNWYDVVPQTFCEVRGRAEMLEIGQLEPTFIESEELMDFDDSMPSVEEIENDIDGDPEGELEPIWNTVHECVPYSPDSSYMGAWDQREYKMQRREHQATLNRITAQAIENIKTRARLSARLARQQEYDIREKARLERMAALRASLIASGKIVPAPVSKVPDQPMFVQISDKEKENGSYPVRYH